MRRRLPTRARRHWPSIEAANAEEEALAIAVALREAVETPDKTAALVTPDRALARRVLAALERWNVAADDSGGDALRRHPGRRVRAPAARSRARRACAGDAARAAQASAAAARRGGRRARCARSPRWNARCCAGRGRGRARPASRRRSRRSAPSSQVRRRELAICTAPIRARGLIDGRARCRRGARRAADRGTCAARRDRPARTPSPILPRVHRSVIAALIATDGAAKLPSRTRRRDARATRFDEIAISASAADLAVAPADYAELFRDRDRRPRGAAAAAAGRAGAHLWPARSALATHRSHRARRAGRRRVAAGDAHAIPGSAARCGSSSGSICPSGASGFRRTISRRCSARREVILDARRQDRRRADASARASCSGSPRSRATALEAVRDARRTLSRLGAQSRSAGERQARRGPRRSRRAPRGRPRSRSPRSSTGCAIPIRSTPSTCSSCARSMPSISRPAPPIAAPSFTMRCANSPSASPTRLPADPAGALIEIGEQAFCRARRFSRSARLLVAALPAHRALVRRLGGEPRAPVASHSRPKSAARSRFRLAERVFTLRARADRIERLPTAAMPSSTTRPDRCRARNRCAPGFAPQLTLEAAMLRQRRIHPTFRCRRRPLRSWSMSRSKAAQPAGERMPIDFKEGTPTPCRPRAGEARPN